MNALDLILLVDDDAFAVKVISLQLKKLGFSNLKAFTEPVEALDFFKLNSEQIVTIVCDLQMPTLDGIEFVREVGAYGFEGQLLLVSGEDPRVLRSAQKLVSAMGLKILGGIQKPVKLEILTEIFSTNNPALRLPTAERQGLAEHVQSALETNQFVNFYQPKVAVKTGEIVGWEALIRWQHPTLGVVGPASFLPEIENKGLGNPLLLHVLSGPTGALALLRDCGVSDPEMKIAVNLADSNLQDARLPDMLFDLCRQFGVSQKQLVLEISEDRVAVNRMLAATTLSRLALKGFSLSLDDFGAGKTTMGDLSDIAIDELKFDRSFISNVHRDGGQKIALNSCIKMAQTLGMNTVAEGVETLEEWRVIQELGCTVVQGFLIAKPMPVAAMAAWKRAWAERVVDSVLFKDELLSVGAFEFESHLSV
jgi:EAL domain-containing protein (putative c-di-GMP-specific phosphodiesterase class I)/FixJ family two-component response regulator